MRKAYITKGLGLVRHISIATGVKLGARVRAPNASCPVSTEGNIEHDVQVPKLGIVVTPSTEVCDRGTPSSRVGVSAPDVCRDVAGSKVPHLDSTVCP